MDVVTILYNCVHVTSTLIIKKKICSILLQLIKQSGKIIADMESQ